MWVENSFLSMQVFCSGLNFDSNEMIYIYIHQSGLVNIGA